MVGPAGSGPGHQLLTPPRAPAPDTAPVVGGPRYQDPQGCDADLGQPGRRRASAPIRAVRRPPLRRRPGERALEQVNALSPGWTRILAAFIYARARSPGLKRVQLERARRERPRRTPKRPRAEEDHTQGDAGVPGGRGARPMTEERIQQDSPDADLWLASDPSSRARADRRPPGAGRPARADRPANEQASGAAVSQAAPATPRARADQGPHPVSPTGDPTAHGQGRTHRIQADHLDTPDPPPQYVTSHTLLNNDYQLY